MKFNNEEFIKNFYIEGNTAFIIVKANKIEELVNKYSSEYYEVINFDFAKYLEYNAYYIPTNYPIVIKIIGKFNESEKDIIKNVIKDYFGLKLGDIEIDINDNKKRQNIILLFGIASLFIVFLLSLLNIISMLYEPFLIVTWVFIWEYLEIRLFKKTKLLKQKTEAIQLANINIEIMEKN